MNRAGANWIGLVDSVALARNSSGLDFFFEIGRPINILTEAQVFKFNIEYFGRIFLDNGFGTSITAAFA